MQNSKESQGEIRKPSSEINARKERKTIEWKRLTLQAKMGSIKDRNGMDLTEAGDIEKWQEYTEKLYKKFFTTQIITTQITHLEPCILECEVKWDLKSITTEGWDGEGGGSGDRGGEHM